MSQRSSGAKLARSNEGRSRRTQRQIDWCYRQRELELRGHEVPRRPSLGIDGAEAEAEAPAEPPFWAPEEDSEL